MVPDRDQQAHGESRCCCCCFGQKIPCYFLFFEQEFLGAGGRNVWKNESGCQRTKEQHQKFSNAFWFRSMKKSFTIISSKFESWIPFAKAITVSELGTSMHGKYKPYRTLPSHSHSIFAPSLSLSMPDSLASSFIKSRFSSKTQNQRWSCDQDSSALRSCKHRHIEHPMMDVYPLLYLGLLGGEYIVGSNPTRCTCFFFGPEAPCQKLPHTTSTFRSCRPFLPTDIFSECYVLVTRK